MTSKNKKVRTCLFIVIFYFIALGIYGLHYTLISISISEPTNEVRIASGNNYILDKSDIWGGSLSERGKSIVVDDLGNIYITGYTTTYGPGQEDAFVLKYNSSGDLVKEIFWGDTNRDYGRDIALDDDGNIYITGETNSLGSGYQAFIAKFNNSGVEEWNVTWGSSADDYGRGIVLDDSGDITITGYTDGPYAGLDDAFIAKFNNSGIQEWNATWGGSSYDYGNSIALDDSGNAYITGSTRSFGDYIDVFTAKYNSSGIQKWNSTWGGSTNNIEVGYGITVDTSGIIYVTGYTESFGSGLSDAFILKYNSSGVLNKTIFWGGTDRDYGYDITLDNSGNIYISGATNSFGSGYQALISKYNNTGHSQVNITWGGSLNDYGNGITLDLSGNIYIVGETESFGSGYQAFYVKYLLELLGAFTLGTNTTNPDTDGNFLLTWDESIDADNYSVYRHDSYINEIRNNGTLIAEGIQILSHTLESYASGDYYFIVYAYNEFINRSSNCVYVQVKLPPGGFTLGTNATNPDIDGNFLLNWSESIDADNYSVYRHDSYINEIRNNGTLIAEGVKSLNYTLENYASGDYYFMVYAYNTIQNRSSNCILVQVQLPPGGFILTINSTLPDTDGKFWLNWSASIDADNYSIYWSKSSNVNENDSLYVEGLVSTSILIQGFTTGTFYFRIVSINEVGFTWSNELTIEIQIPSGGNRPGNDNFLWYIIIILAVVAVSAFGIIYSRVRSKRGRDQEILSLLKQRKMTNKIITDDEIAISKEQNLCLVHKGPIEGFSFICPDCGAKYCNRCYEAIKKTENMCWSCQQPLDKSKQIIKEKKEKEKISIITDLKKDETKHKKPLKEDQDGRDPQKIN